ncbi:MAG: ATP-binding protein [Sphaerospermopsis sp.]|nr:ATP-binding protein [Sphaerospermopsis sp.]
MQEETNLEFHLGAGNGSELLSNGVAATIIQSTDKQVAMYRKLAELEAIYATAPVGLCFLDTELRYVRINRVLAEINGLSISQHIGRSIREIVPDVSPQLEAIFAQTKETKSPLLEQEVHGMTFGKPGVERCWLVSFYPLLDKNSELLGFNLTVQEVTDKKCIEKALRHSEERYRSLIEATSQIIWDTLAEGELVTPQPGWSAFTGQSFDEYQGWGWLNAVHPDDRANTASVWSNAVAKRCLYEVEHRLRRYDGEYRYMSVRAVPVFERDGRIREWVGVHTDITYRKQAEVEREELLAREQAARAQAEAANRVKDEFLAVLSHELRSPLNPILGWTKMLQTGKLSPQKTQEALTVIERNAKLQTQLIEDLLDVSRILQGKFSLNIELIDLEPTIFNALETIGLAAQAKSINLVFKVAGDAYQVFDEEEFTKLKSQTSNPQFKLMADATRLQQVFWNLLSNAVKFTPDGGRVEVHLEEVNRQARITVTDTGKGISPEFLPHVFDYFRQSDSATTRKFGGLGLGLAIAKQLVELHGGTVTAISPGEGKGATFTVNLPLLETDYLTGEQGNMSLAGVDLQNLERVKILIVDDDTDSRELIAFVLTEEGAIVTQAASAFAALEIFSKSMPDILVSDIGMPEMDGYGLIRQIRTLPKDKGGDIPAVALTAYAGEYDEQQALNAGFQKHITKPVDPLELTRILTELTKEKSFL